MKLCASILVGFVALQHFGFLILEMFLWTEPIGIQTFGLTPEFAAESKAIAANQGLYNGFLSAGLFWSLMTRTDVLGKRVFFLSCVIVAGGFGAATASPSILFVQAMPAAVALAFVLLANRGEGQSISASA